MDDGDTLATLNRLVGAGMASDLAMKVSHDGLEEAEAWTVQRRRDRARTLFSLPSRDWPKLDVPWDIDPRRFHLSMDGMSEDEFARRFSGVQTAGVDAADLHANLVRASRRPSGPFAAGYKSKSAGLVAYLETDGLVTPPFVRHLGGGICLVGGHHRFGWARHRKQGRVPILVLADEVPALGAELPTLGGWP